MKRTVVIGGGLGGLAASIRLLQHGNQVTLAEKEPRVGGYSVGFKRKGFSFDLALHVVPSGGPGQEFSTMLDSLGVGDKIQFIRLAKGFEVHLGDYHFQMPNDFDQLLGDLKTAFPHEKTGLENFGKDLEAHVTKYAPIFAYGIPKYRSIPGFVTKLPHFLQHSSQSTKNYLQRFFHDSRLMAILFQPAAFMGISMDLFPTVNFMMMFYLLLKNGMYTIRGGGQELTNRLLQQFLDLGGHLMVHSEAEKFVIHNKKVIGVELSEGRRLSCDAVIAGNNLYDVVNRFIGKSYFTRKYMDNLAKLRPSVSVLALNLGLDCTPQELGVKNHIAMIYPDSDIDNSFTTQQERIEPVAFSVTANGNSASDGDHLVDHNVMSIIGGTAPEKWFSLDQDQYRDEKKRVTENVIFRISDYFPDLPAHIVTSDLATPRSMFRYTGNPQGAIMGFNCTVGEHRQLIQASKLPISNVVMGSAWTNRLGGFMQSVKSGILAAEKIR